jgi:hypothetical protein
MTRIVRTESPAALRTRLRRTVAEAMARAREQPQGSTEVRDAAAVAVLALRGIAASVESSATAWEQRHYYSKADRLRAEWGWAERFAERLGRVVTSGDWARLEAVWRDLEPRVAGAAKARPLLGEDAWRGAFGRLAAE